MTLSGLGFWPQLVSMSCTGAYQAATAIAQPCLLFAPFTRNFLGFPWPLLGEALTEAARRAGLTYVGNAKRLYEPHHWELHRPVSSPRPAGWGSVCVVSSVLLSSVLPLDQMVTRYPS